MLSAARHGPAGQPLDGQRTREAYPEVPARIRTSGLPPRGNRKPEDCLGLIARTGKKAGISLNPDTPVDSVRTFLPNLDAVLLMSVFPGFGGQKFIPETLERIRQARRMIQ